MEIVEFAPALQQVIARFHAWNEALGDAGDDAGLSKAERAALLDELRGVIEEEPDVLLTSDPWQVLMGFFSPRTLSHVEECERREHALLQSYEQVCELKLPFHLSNTLLRHHGAIKRAAHMAHDRLYLPTPSRGSSITTSPSPTTPAR